MNLKAFHIIFVLILIVTLLIYAFDYFWSKQASVPTNRYNTGKKDLHRKLKKKSVYITALIRWYCCSCNCGKHTHFDKLWLTKYNIARDTVPYSRPEHIMILQWLVWAYYTNRRKGQNHRNLVPVLNPHYTIMSPSCWLLKDYSGKSFSENFLSLSSRLQDC